MFLLELEKKKKLINLNKISVNSYLKEKLSWAKQTFVDSRKLFSRCKSRPFKILFEIVLKTINICVCMELYIYFKLVLFERMSFFDINSVPINVFIYAKNQ